MNLGDNMKKYYEAYDDRYKQVHKEGLSWSTNNNTKIVEEIINKYLLEKTNMLEIGCGEGRDARYLLNKKYNVLATDISKEAIDYCVLNDQNHINNYLVLDVLNDNDFNKRFGFIYSVACLHMFVLDDDRDAFYNFIYNHLEKDGYSLILSMGDGKEERQTDISNAFNIIERTHQETNKKLSVVETSCRIVNYNTLFNEIKRKNLKIVEYGITKIDNHFNEMIYVVIRR